MKRDTPTAIYLEQLFRKGYDAKARWTPLKGLLQHVTNKWTFLVLLCLCRQEVLRFMQLKTFVGGISAKMLSKTLGELEYSGLIQRQEFAETPLRVEYRIHARGKKFLHHLVQLLECFEQEHHSLVKA